MEGVGIEGPAGDASDELAEFVEIGVSEPLFARAVISADRAASREDWRVSDRHGRVVAVVPGPGGREARALDKSYLLDIERQRFSWNVVLRVAGTSSVAAIAAPTFGFASYELQFPASRRRKSLRLSRRWTGVDWRLRGHRKLLLSIASVTGRMSGYRIVVAERGLKEIPLGMPLILALHTVLLHGTIPKVSVAA